MNIMNNVLRATFAYFVATLMGGASATSLPELVLSSLSSHPSVRVQEALSRAAQAGVGSARWQYFPTPSVGVEQVSASGTDLSYRYGDKNVSTLRLQQPLWTGGRLTAGFEKSKASEVLSLATVQLARQELAVRVVQAYVEWYGGTVKAVAFERSLQSHLRLERQIIRRIEEGVAPKNDRTLVVGRIEQTRTELIVAEGQQRTALSRLRQLLGRTVTSAELTASLAKPQNLGVAQSMVDQALADSPSVARMVANARVLEIEIDERKADMTPEVYLRMERQYGNFNFRGRPPENRIFLGVSTRFGAGLSGLTAIDTARSRHESALAEVSSTRISLSEQIYGDHVYADNAERRLVSLQASLLSAQAVSQAWSQQFLVGLKSWLDVMNAARELAQVEVQIADASTEQLLLSWRLSILARGVDTAMNEGQSHE
jgi:adhesin transport system outer membrane protein